jgi:membrane fusion protein, multidrug efflux system
MPSVVTPRRSRAKFVAIGLVAAAAIAFGLHWLLTRNHESTDDAQVEGHIYPVSARIPGQVVAVRIKDNQAVKAGDVLVELDRTDLQVRLDSARADLAAARAQAQNAQAQLALTEKSVGATLRQAAGSVNEASSGVSSLRAAREQAHADVTAAEAALRLAESEYKRAEGLFAADAVTKAEMDSRRAALDQARAQLEQARAHEDSARASISSGQGALQLAEGRRQAAQTGPEQLASAQAEVALADSRVKQSESAVRAAELNVSYATVRAPAAGVVSKRNVEVGQTVAPERALLALVATDDLWVVANFKETQVGEMRPGQPAEVDVDAFSGDSLSGHVESIAGATGARFALLPPDNASGNFVKVVQRVPVLIRIDHAQGIALRPGLSADVTVTVGQ